MLLDKDISVLFRVALGIISIKEVGIMSCSSTNELVQLVMNPRLDSEEGPIEASRFMDLVHIKIKRVPLQDLQERRSAAYVTQRKEFEEYQTRKEMVLLSRTTHCESDDSKKTVLLMRDEVDAEQIQQLKQKFSKVANEDGFVTPAQFRDLLLRLPATQDNPELIDLYLKVS
jgi:Ca2+-binding EF-hand superfamily protein